VNCKPIKTEHVFSVASDPLDGNENLINDKGKIVDNKDDEVKSRKAISERYGGRFIWMFLIGVNVLFCLISLIVFVLLIYNSVGFKWTAGLLLGIVIIGIALGSYPDVNTHLTGPALKATIESKREGVINIFAIMSFVNILNYVTILLQVVTICAILFPKKEKTILTNISHNNFNNLDDLSLYVHQNEKNNCRIQSLIKKKDYLQIVLFISAGLLVVGVLRMKSVLDWSVTFMTPETVGVAKVFFANLTTVIGGFFTLLLTSTYLPAAFILQKRAELLFKNSEVLKKQGFTFSFSESLPRILAIAAPLLTGPIAELFKNSVAK
jgi:hypothetical protein